MASYNFKIHRPEASEVYVTGDFDNWAETKNRLWKHADGWHRERVEIPDPTVKHLFKFLIDGKWSLDDTHTTETDSAGNVNNVLSPDEIEKSSGPGAATMSTVGAGATTAGLAAAVPKEGEKDDNMPGAFPSETANEEGKSPDIDFFPGDEVPDYSRYSSNPVGTSARSGEQTFGVAPLPATAGTGNPVQLKPGEAVPPSESITSNTTTSNVKLDKESYERSDAYPGGASGGAADPTIQSSGAGTTTAALAGQVPKEDTKSDDGEKSTLTKAATGGAGVIAGGAAAFASYLGFNKAKGDSGDVKAEETPEDKAAIASATGDKATTSTTTEGATTEPQIHDENTAPAIAAAGSPGILPSANETDPSSKGVDASQSGPGGGLSTATGAAGSTGVLSSATGAGTGSKDADASQSGPGGGLSTGTAAAVGVGAAAVVGGGAYAATRDTDAAKSTTAGAVSSPPDASTTSKLTDTSKSTTTGGTTSTKDIDTSKSHPSAVSSSKDTPSTTKTDKHEGISSGTKSAIMGGAGGAAVAGGAATAAATSGTFSNSGPFKDDPVSAPGYDASTAPKPVTSESVAAFKDDPTSADTSKSTTTTGAGTSSATTGLVAGGAAATAAATGAVAAGATSATTSTTSPEGKYGITAPKDAGAIGVQMREGQIKKTDIVPKSDTPASEQTGGDLRAGGAAGTTSRAREESRELSPGSKPAAGSAAGTTAQKAAKGSGWQTEEKAAQATTGTTGTTSTSKTKKEGFLSKLKRKFSKKDKAKATS